MFLGCDSFCQACCKYFPLFCDLPLYLPCGVVWYEQKILNLCHHVIFIPLPVLCHDRKIHFYSKFIMIFFYILLKGIS